MLPLTAPEVAKKLLKAFTLAEALPVWTDWLTTQSIDPSIGADVWMTAWKEEMATRKGRAAGIPGEEKPEALSGTELLALNIPKPSWIINNVIPSCGLVAISGKPGSYKSFFALWLAMRAAAGEPQFDDTQEPFFCEQRTVHSPTLFIEEENTTILTRDRYYGLRQVPGAHLYFRIDQGFKMQDEEWRKALLADVEAKGIKLIVADPFSSVMGLEDENNNAEVAVVMDLIRKEFIAKGITFVFIHHPAKGDGEGKGLRGAGDILGKCDVQLHLEKDEEDPCQITVSYEKMRLLRPDAVQNWKMRFIGDEALRDQRFRYLGEAKRRYEEEREK
jgi:hypothetical protein